MITVHHLDNSRSQRVLWLLEELNLTYDIKFYKRDQGMLAPPELKAVHPLGKSPVITDVPGTIAESGAIIDYLVSAYGPQLAPPVGMPERLRYNYWMYAAEGSFMQPLVLKLITTEIRKRVPFFIRPIASGIASAIDKRLVDPNIAANAALWESALAEFPWFVGETFTAADIMMSFPLEAARSRGGLGDKPHIKAWLETIHARPAYRRALERGGAYVYA
ncbi:glutathione S-transferase, N-terminal domain protein [Asticcacaulis biprosthecium C19]|uniref:glutathione transferase n=1 Tax=Asticcacaulis biprosthecium C19 TaxID=715226 RepID=F4QR19_9CAUL|nr:glutathione S-transferase [Asticcacaulis biprosthecium]EGF90656.1 glutathione S-transferase, N-terminal domain protein [Asticcacaulis biprosthecium C19]